MADTSEDARRLDLEGYESPERALELAAEGCPEVYTQIARAALDAMPSLTTGGMAYMAFVSRMRGLHEGVVREVAANNPHAAIPLIRAWAEVVTIGLYVLRHPGYVELLLYGPGDGRPGKKSFEAMFHAIKDDAEQMKLVYRELSEFSHFGPLAIWNVHSVESEDDGASGWTDVPRWKHQRDFQIACAQAHELALASQDCLSRLGSVLPEHGDDIGRIEVSKAFSDGAACN